MTVPPGMLVDVHVEVYVDAHEFQQAAAPFVAANPAETTVLATVLKDVISGARTYSGARWFLVRKRAGIRSIVGVALQTPPHPLWFSPMPDEAAVAIVDAVVAEEGRPTHLAGERDAAEAAAARWRAADPTTTAREARAMRLFVLDELLAPRTVGGGARVAGTADIDQIVEWWQAFAVEADSLGGDHARDAVSARIAGHGAVLLWEVDGESVAMAGHTDSVEGIARLGPVYTPPSRRCQGYGSAITDACVRHALEAGSTGVVLFTDLANPTSNSIYSQIGFQPVRDYVEIALVTSAT